MPLSVRSTIRDDAQRVRDFAQSFPQRRARAQQRIGFYLLSKQRQHFGQLVKSGASNGVTWPKPAQSTLRKRQSLARRGLLFNTDPEQLGVKTGRLARSFRFRVRGTAVELFNSTPYANAFAKRRPIFPASIPGPWLSGCESIVLQALKESR